MSRRSLVHQPGENCFHLNGVPFLISFPILAIKKLLKPLFLRSTEESNFYSQQDNLIDTNSAAGQYAQWFLQSEPYRHWKSDSHLSPRDRFLWYTGRPDAAFSAVTTLAARDAHENRKHEDTSQHLIVKLFCAGLPKDNRAVKHCSIRDILLRTLSQVVQQEEDILDRLGIEYQADLLRFCDSDSDFPFLAYDLLGILVTLTSKKGIWFFVDCLHLVQPEHDRGRLLNEFKNLIYRSRSSQDLDLRILVTSLPFAPIATALMGLPMVDSAFEAQGRFQYLE
jgi:hypothetical protein